MDNIDEVIELKPSKEAEKKVYKCTMCRYETRLGPSLRKHMKTHLALEDRQLFVCTHCDKKYTTKKALQRHLDINHVDSRSQAAEEEVFHCTTCGFQTLRAKYLHDHKKIHLSREERQLFPCTLCDKNFLSKSYLRCHFTYKHTDFRLKGADKKVYKCAICGFRTLYKASLRSHKKTHFAPEVRQFACLHCDNKYTSRKSLRQHIENKHIDSRSKAARKNIHKCSICGYQTPYISHLRRHQEIHLARDERQLFACPHCDKKYTVNQRLKDHLNTGHFDSRSEEAEKNVYKCTMCRFETRREPSLRQHMKTHLAPEDRQLFACTHCDKKFIAKHNLRGHLANKHIDSRNADCTTSTAGEVILDALKIEIDDVASPLGDSKNSECLSVTNEIKSEDFIKTEPEDVAPIMKTEVHDDLKNSENESATRNVKLEDFIKMEPDDDV